MINNVDYYSRRTSCNRIPMGIRVLAAYYSHLKYNLDYGGGRFDTSTKFLAEAGITNYVYDPYNRSPEHNTAALAREFSSVTLLNVLNVIEDRSERIEVIRDAYNRLKAGVLIIQIYEGNRSGVGKITKSKTYQHNHRLNDYRDEIKEALPWYKMIWERIDKYHIIIISKSGQEEELFKKLTDAKKVQK